MEDSDGRLLAPLIGDRAMHRHVVAGEAGVVRLGRVEGIASAVTDIEQGEIEPLQHVMPEREVGIAREAVAVAQNDAHPGGIAVAHDPDRRSVVHHEVESCQGLGQNEPVQPRNIKDPSCVGFKSR